MKPSIRVIQPDEKLLIAFPPDIIVPQEVLNNTVKAVKKFRESGNLLIMSNAEIYIIKDGKQILLKDELEIENEAQ